jgi:hypothetical protein
MGRGLICARSTLVLIAVACGTAAIGCSAGSAAPTRSAIMPTAPGDVSMDALAALRPQDAGHAGSSHGLQLTAVAGSGSGVVNVTSTAIDGVYTLNTQDSINVHGVPPNTVLYVRGAGDTGLPNGQQSDGICQRAALGLFGSVALFPGGPPATIETTAGGTGAVHVIDGRNSPALTDGVMTDIMLRLVDALPPAAPTIDLRTPCFTLFVR